MRDKRKWIAYICVGVMCIALCGFLINALRDYQAAKGLQEQQETLEQMKEQSQENTEKPTAHTSTDFPTAGVQKVLDEMWKKAWEEAQKNAEKYKPATILPEYQDLYEKNNDLIGWLTIDDTVIDYPVMQTLEDEDYYLYRDFDKGENKNGCLIMDTDSTVGSGTKANDYLNGTAPSTNLIIHGHTMKTGLMFGGLKKYAEESYGNEHNIIKFDSLYEHREYELISVFYSKLYYTDEDVFKYYQFFQADTKEQFETWYSNIKSMALYDTGVTAEYGDEFITLSCCAYHTENGRLAVVGKRIK